MKDAADAWTRTDRGMPAYGWTELATHLQGDADTLLAAIDEATADPWMRAYIARWPPQGPANDTVAALPEQTPPVASVEDALRALPDWVAAHVRACREQLRTPLEMNVANALGVLGGAASGRLKVQVLEGHVAHTY